VQKTHNAKFCPNALFLSYLLCQPTLFSLNAATIRDPSIDCTYVKSPNLNSKCLFLPIGAGSSKRQGYNKKYISLLWVTLFFLSWIPSLLSQSFHGAILNYALMKLVLIVWTFRHHLDGSFDADSLVLSSGWIICHFQKC
jgi:hypothetical protein